MPDNVPAFFRPTAITAALILLFVFAASAAAQSSDQNFPTSITSNQLTGVVRPRDIGDNRLTTYYYELAGGQGDVFVNVSFKNFNGDIDLFNADEDMRPLAKMTIYADVGETETGRVVYLRKPARLILRVQGQTPDENPAAFQIKFAGSFVAVRARRDETPPTVSSDETQGRVRVSSSGQILPSQASTRPTPATPVAKTPASAGSPTTVGASPAETGSTRANGNDVAVEKPAETPTRNKRPPVAEKQKPADETTREASPVDNSRVSAKKRKAPSPQQKVTVAEMPADPMASVHLVIQLKKGKLIERPMSEVLRFTVDKGVLTVISKDGQIARYALLDVSKVTIQ